LQIALDRRRVSQCWFHFRRDRDDRGEIDLGYRLVVKLALDKREIVKKP
jgi:hypothetical protein